MSFPHQTPNGKTVTIVLDWRDKSHWGGGVLRPCRSCGQSALCVDDAGRPQHKVCAEYEQEQATSAEARQ